MKNEGGRKWRKIAIVLRALMILLMVAYGNGSYTRVTRTGARRGDAAEMAVIELI